MFDLPTPYVAFLGDARDPLDIKTALGVRDWAPEKLIGEWSLDGCEITLGLAKLDPEAAVAAGARSLLIGVASFGGQIPEAWVPALCRALHAGLTLVSGLHQRLGSIPEIAAAAAASGCALHDVRHGPELRSVASGRRRSGKRLLTVGTDCALGKKYTALAIARGLRARGVDADFRATGQTGILIAGSGIAIDAVVADFIAGAAEQISPDAAPDHWDVIEGQGALFHPAYSGVSLGLLHGSQPDAFVLCHDPLRQHIDGYPDHPLPALQDAIELHERMGAVTNPAIRCVGVSLNTSRLAAEDRLEAIAATGRALGLPCMDPLLTGPDAILDRLLGNADAVAQGQDNA